MKTEQYEENIVKDLCIGKTLDADSFANASQYKVLGLLCMHRCAGIAYYHLQKNSQLSMLNREMRTTLQSVYESGVRKETDMKTCMAYLGKLLGKTDFHYALLKGAKLLELYPEGTRTSNDIDILIERESVPNLTKILTENGFRQGYIRNNRFVLAERKDIVNAMLNRGETTPFIKEMHYESMKYLEVDVNLSVDERSTGCGEVVKEMLAHAVPRVDVGKGWKLSALDEVDFLIHLCTHLYKEASVYQWVEMGRDLCLYKFLDILVYWKACMDESLVPLLKERTERYGVREAVCYALYGTDCLWGLKSAGLLQMLKEWKDTVQEVMNLVYDPSKKQWYRYSDTFEERVLNEHHRECLSVL